YFLLLVNRVFFGRLSPMVQNLERVYWSDRLPAIALVIVIILFGLQPNYLSMWSETKASAIVAKSQILAQPLLLQAHRPDLVITPN
ncbi:MAG: NAD(P)H-quinone oxidoreductase subunit D4, partial [Microcoleaceae cyanobacterium]